MFVHASCGGEVFSTFKKIDEFVDAFLCVTSLVLSNSI